MCLWVLLRCTVWHSVIEVLYGSFTSMASQSWNFCWVVNFLLVLYNPLRSHRKNMKWYHLFSWTMSTAAVVYALASESYQYVFVATMSAVCGTVVHTRYCAASQTGISVGSVRIPPN